MGTKPRTPGQTAVSISLPEKLLLDIDARADALNINRSQYLAALARNDLSARGILTLQETTEPAPAPPAKPTGATTYPKASKRDTQRKILRTVENKVNQAKNTQSPQK
jgi:hypothetical protein